MKTNYLTFLVISCFFISILNSQNIVRYETGIIDTFQNLQFKNPILKAPYLLTGHKNIPFSEISYFENQEGYFVRYHFHSQDFLLVRKVNGRIKTYNKMYPPYHGKNYDPKRILFSNQDEKIRRLKPRILKKSTKDCQPCQEILRKTRSKDILKIIVMTSGAVLTLHGFYEGLNQTYFEPKIPQMLIGFGLFTTPIFIKKYRNRDMQKVIKIYNE